MQINDASKESLESIRDGYLTLDRTWHITYLNRRAAAIMGREQEELTGKVIWSEFPVMLGTPLEAAYRQAMDTGRVQRLEMPGLLTGTWYYIFVCPVAEGITVYWQDIFGQKEAEDKLACQAQLLACVHDAIVAVDEHFIITYWSEMAGQLFGWTAAVALGQPYYEIFKTIVPGTTGEAAIQDFYQNGCYAGEAIYSHKDGRSVYVDMHTKAIQDRQGSFQGAVFSYRDISARQQAEAALAESERKYRELVKQAPTGIFEIDLRSWRFLSANDVGWEYLGYSMEELLALHPLEPLDEPSRRLFERQISQTLKGEKPDPSIDYKVKTKDGREIYVLFNLSITTDEHGRPLRATVVAHDITERKQAKEMLRAGKEHALNLVAKLRQADQNKNAFINMLSHELRNPLASIVMSCDLLEMVPWGSELSLKARATVKRQLKQLTRIVDDLLDMTRLTQNKITLQKERVDLNELVEQAVADYQGRFAEKEVVLEASLAEGPLWLEADPARLTQVLGNLLHNAAKFTPPGGRALVTVAGDTANQGAVITVQDTGAGLNPELLSELFSPFVQAEQGMARSEGGLGLGLSIVKGMVELHGGSVAAHSDGPGLGTQFTIRLPLQHSAAQEEAAGSNRLVARYLRVLVIDDMPDMAEILCVLLSYLGHEAEAAFSGPEGLAKAHEFKPEVVICDIEMPDMNGYAVASRLRKDEALKGLHLIALSGYANQEDLERSQAAGFNRHLVKPVDLDALNKLLRDIN